MEERIREEFAKEITKIAAALCFYCLIDRINRTLKWQKHSTCWKAEAGKNYTMKECNSTHEVTLHVNAMHFFSFSSAISHFYETMKMTWTLPQALVIFYVLHDMWTWNMPEVTFYL